MTLVEGERGVIMIDTLLCKETAAAAWKNSSRPWQRR